jgi:hypothetical protein
LLADSLGSLMTTANAPLPFPRQVLLLDLVVGGLDDRDEQGVGEAHSSSS